MSDSLVISFLDYVVWSASQQGSEHLVGEDNGVGLADDEAVEAGMIVEV